MQLLNIYNHTDDIEKYYDIVKFETKIKEDKALEEKTKHREKLIKRAIKGYHN